MAAALTNPRQIPPARQIRLEERRALIDYISHGKSCALVGPSNIGKSSLLRSLFLDDARREIDSSSDTATVIVLVDCQMATEKEEDLYALVLRKVIDRLESETIPSSTLGTIKKKHGEMLAGANDVAFRSLFASSFNLLAQESDVRLVIMLDELDDAFLSLPPWPFRIMRALRDELYGRLSFITATSRRLERLRPDSSLYEFREMFHTQILMLRPLDHEDSEICYDNLVLSEPGGSPGDDSETRKALVLTLAGGNPGLMKRIYHVLSSTEIDPTISIETWVTRLMESWPVQQECLRLWEELEVEERESLLSFVAHGGYGLDPSQEQALVGKGILLQGNEERKKVFSPVFTAFIKDNLARMRHMGTRGVTFDPETGRSWVDGKEITLDLTEQQRALLRLLHQRQGRVVNMMDVQDAVWGPGAMVNNDMLYELIKRLRQKIEPDPSKPQYLITLRGEGYMLKTPE